MTIPDFPSANPGGEDTWIMRTALYDWLTAQRIRGVGKVLKTLQPLTFFEEFSGGGEACILMINIVQDNEQLKTSVGPDNPGGREIHYNAEIHIKHRGIGADNWEASQRDYDRIKDFIKQALRGPGADLGRPDVILQAAIWNGGIEHLVTDPAVDQDGGYVDRWGRLAFTISQYLPTFIPSAP